jgi:hypothetical protein
VITSSSNVIGSWIRGQRFARSNCAATSAREIRARAAGRELDGG